MKYGKNGFIHTHLDKKRKKKKDDFSKFHTVWDEI